jgi:CheY-like chemotaxis protein
VGMSNRTVLVIDDCPENLKLLTILLEFGDFTVTTATGGEEALAMLAGDFAAGLPDLVLSDIQMPGMNGIELIRLLRANPRTAELLILAVSANAMQESIDAAHQAGCDGYITKPVDTRTFTKEVTGYLDRGRDRGRSQRPDLLHA